MDDEVWAALRLQSRQSGLTISELVRRAVRERYVGPDLARKQAMAAFAGSRRDRTDIGDSTAYVRRLRKGTRLTRLSS